MLTTRQKFRLRRYKRILDREAKKMKVYDHKAAEELMLRTASAYRYLLSDIRKLPAMSMSVKILPSVDKINIEGTISWESK